MVLFHRSALVAVALLAFPSNAFQAARPMGARIMNPMHQQPLHQHSFELKSDAAAFGATEEAAADETAVVCDPYNPRLCDPVEIPKEKLKKFNLQRFVKLTTLFGIWYVLNIGYNIGNKLVSPPPYHPTIEPLWCARPTPSFPAP